VEVVCVSNQEDEKAQVGDSLGASKWEGGFPCPTIQC